MKQVIEGVLLKAIETLKSQQKIKLSTPVEVKVERTKDKAHGDFATNLALILAKPCQMAPRAIADILVLELQTHPIIAKVEIAGPGFINFFVNETEKSLIVSQVLAKGSAFGQSDYGQHKKILLEYVSANPTGPLHVGHGRGAAFGATLANILKTAGYDVHQEYYVNDAGRQMNILAVSVWLRYLMLFNEPVVFPANGYRGDYVSDIAQMIVDKYGKQYLVAWALVLDTLPEDEPKGGDKELYIDAMIKRAQTLIGDEGFKTFHQSALNSVLDDIKDDLKGFGVVHDEWFSEQSLFDSGAIEKGINALKASGHTFEQEGALWFKSTDFGDEKDRVLVRANGQHTYFAADVAYHWNKFDRGFDKVIDVFGADHHGYIPRLKAIVTALGHNSDDLNILLVQFAILYRGEERVQMSTRSGSFVTLRELREEVGNDACRFFYAMRKPEQHMDFDLELAKSNSNDNPVYYIQYAHARICSVLRQLNERGLTTVDSVGLQHIDSLVTKEERLLIDLLSQYPEVIESAASTCEPHQLSYYLRELANGLHSYYNAVVLLCEDEALRAARMCLLKAVKLVLNNGLMLLGVSAPESM